VGVGSQCRLHIVEVHLPVLHALGLIKDVVKNKKNITKSLKTQKHYKILKKHKKNIFFCLFIF